MPSGYHNINIYLKESNCNSMFLFEIEETEILNLVNHCKHKTSTDYNNINMVIVKKVIGDIVKPFTYICNMSFVQGVFPDQMKVAKVIPLFKSGQKNVFTNYRPVSLLPQFSKILEKLFDRWLDTFIDKYELLSNSQYGFRSNRSTSLALIELLEEITSSLDNKNNGIGVFIDLRKSFDTIDH